LGWEYSLLGNGWQEMGNGGDLSDLLRDERQYLNFCLGEAHFFRITLHRQYSKCDPFLFERHTQPVDGCGADGLKDADLIVGRHERNEDGVGPKSPAHVVGIHDPVRSHGDARHREALALEGPARLEDGRVLENARDHVLAPRGERADGPAHGQGVGEERADPAAIRLGFGRQLERQGHCRPRVVGDCRL
jgi:hypothetical protein